jgi:hypothetical protein
MILLSAGFIISFLLICSIETACCSSQLPGPSSVTFNDDNGTSVTVDFSDVEFYPVEYFPLFTSNKNNATEGLAVPMTAFERQSIKRLINAIDIDQFTGSKPGRLMSASDLPSYHSIPGHPMYQGTPDYSRSYGLSSLGTSTFGHKKFSSLSIDADFGDENVRHYAVARFQNRVNFGRKIVRFTMWQSLNQGKPRHVWLTDASMWRESSLKPLGRLMTPAGYAILWTL